MKNAFSWEKINIYIITAINVKYYLNNRNIYIFSLKKINTCDKISLYMRREENGYQTNRNFC